MKEEQEITLIDSNILIYAHDTTEKEKYKKSIALLEECWRYNKTFAVSVQNLSEFFVVVTEKIEQPIKKKDAKEIIRRIIEFRNWIKCKPEEHSVVKAAELCEEYNIPYWDALIVAVMFENKITRIYTENVKDFNKVKGLEVINPFV